MEIQEMIEKVKAFHRKHDFDIGTKNNTVMLYRQNLLIEELGEISQCLTKGKGDLAEEHADLLILLLGNCVVMDIDIANAFNEKMNKIMERPAKIIGDVKRVSEWTN